MTAPWMIYGANGYTGELTARLAKAQGHAPILAGRSASVKRLAEELGLPSRVFSLGDPGEAGRGLEGMKAVLCCAGPFSATARPMLDACVSARVHYLDITGEISVFEYVHGNAARWRDAGIVAMPGAGFDVVPSDCLAAMLARELPDANRLRLAFRSHRGKLSPGTTKTMIEGVPEGGKIRSDGVIVPVPSDYKVEEIPFTAEESSLAVTIPWGDVSTAFHSTGIPNIEVFMGASPERLKAMRISPLQRKLMGLAPVQALLKRMIGWRVKGPTAEQRAKDEMLLYGKVESPDGRSVEMRLRTPEGYTLTAATSLAATLRVAAGEVGPGAWTPSKAFGPEFILGFEGVRFERVG